MFISTNNLFKTDQNDSPMFTQSEQSFTDTLRKNVTRQLNKTNSNKTQNVSSTTSTPTTNSTPRELTSKRNAWDATDTSSKNIAKNNLSLFNQNRNSDIYTFGTDKTSSDSEKSMYNSFLEGFYHDRLGDRQRENERKQYHDAISRAGTKDSTLDPFLEGFYSAAKDEQDDYYVKTVDIPKTMLQNTSLSNIPNNMLLPASYSPVVSLYNDVNNSDYIMYAKKEKPNYSGNPNKRKGSENRQPSGARERNVGHPDSEEHSRVAKGSGGRARGNVNRSTAEEVGAALLGGAAAAGGGYLIYRGLRMLPSMLPPLWWTIPGNIAMP